MTAPRFPLNSCLLQSNRAFSAGRSRGGTLFYPILVPSGPLLHIRFRKLSHEQAFDAPVGDCRCLQLTRLAGVNDSIVNNEVG